MARLEVRRARAGDLTEKVMAALSKTGKKIPMFLWMQEVPDVQREVLQEFVDTHVENGATIERDGFKTCMGLKNGAINAKVYEV